MKRELIKTIAAVLVVALLAGTTVSCGKPKEPADSLVASETFTEATVPQPEADELTAWVRQAIGDDTWNGDWASLTDAQRNAVQAMLAKKGYNVFVGPNGVTYYSYTPTASEEEIREVVQKVLPDKKWDGEYASLTDAEKDAVCVELTERGYTVQPGKYDFEFRNPADRAEETTRAEYNQLPTKEMLAELVERELGMEGYKKWDGSFLSLTEKQRASILKQLNDYGFHLGVNDKGEMYILHMPQYTVTFDSAYTASPIGGTTQPSTTIPTTLANRDEAIEDNTGTTASRTTPAPTLEQTSIKTFGGSGSDLFNHIEATSDGGYIALMQTVSKDGDLEGADASWRETISAVVKFDKDLNVQWKDLLGEKNQKQMTFGVYLEQVTELIDGSFIAVGYANPVDTTALDAADALMVKYTADGKREWLKRVKGTAADQFECVTAAPDGGYVVGGQIKSGDGDFAMLHENCNDAIVSKYTADGAFEWIKGFNGGSFATHIVALAVTDEGYVYAACQASSNGAMQLDMIQYGGFGKGDGVVFKLDPNGELIAYHAVAGSGADTITCMALCEGNGVLVGGSTGANSDARSVFAGKTNHGDADAFLVRLDASLKPMWINTYGGSEMDRIYAVAKTKKGFVAIGETDSTNGDFSYLGSGETDGFVLTVSENGTSTEKYALSGNKTERARGICVSGDQVVAVGATLSIDGSFTYLQPASDGTNRIGYLARFKVQS